MQKRGEAVKKAIVDAAARAFREKGYRSASVDFIATGAGVSKATVYAHFRNKEELFKATVLDFVTPLLQLLPPARPVEDVREELIRVAGAFSLALLSSEKVEWDRMMVSTAKQFPNLAATYFEAGPQRAMTGIAKFLQIQHENGKLHVPDPEFSAEMFCGMLFGTRILRNLISPQQTSLDLDKVHRSVDAFLKVHQL